MDPISTYRQFLEDAKVTPEYIDADEETKQKYITSIADQFKAEFPQLAGDADREAQRSYQLNRDARGEGRYINPNMNKLQISAPWSQPGYDDLDEDKKLEKIDEFRSNIETNAAADLLNSDDTAFFLHQIADNQQRIAQSKDTGSKMDTALRVVDSLGSNLARAVGADELAEDISLSIDTNPEFDANISSKIIYGAGSVVSSIGTFAAGAALGGGVGGIAALALSNGTMRYQSGYKEAIDLGLDPEAAHQAGIGAMPAAAIDVFADRLLAGSFLGKNYTRILASGSKEAKAAAVAEIFANQSLRGRAMEMVRAGLREGTAELTGDAAAGYGSYAATGEDDFISTKGELWESFWLGGVLGSGVSGIGAIKNYGKDKKALEEIQASLEEVSEESVAAEAARMVDAGDMAGATKLVQNAKIKGKKDPKSVDETEEAIAPTLPGVKVSASGAIEVDGAEEELFNISPKKDKVLEDALQEEFTAGVRSQKYYPSEAAAALAETPKSEQQNPIPLRVGIAERSLDFPTPAVALVDKITADYNNIKLVEPTGIPVAKSADFTAREREGAPEGTLANIASNPDINTKIDEALARKQDILIVEDVNEESKEYRSEDTPFADLSGMNVQMFEQEVEGESQPRNLSYIDDEASLDVLIGQLDSKFGKDRWVLKDAYGAASVGIFIGGADLKSKFKDILNGDLELYNYSQEGAFVLNGLYAEAFNESYNTSNPEYRVHVIKQDGKLTVVPFASQLKTQALPFVLRTPGVLIMEQAVLAELNKMNDSIAENAVMGVDVFKGPNDQWVVSETNPSQVQGDGYTDDSSSSLGISGYLNTAYTQAAIYAHLKGRVPAFALIGRQILRNKMAEQAKVKNISTEISRIYGNTKDKLALQKELIKTYGERISDRVEDIWNALQDSFGQVSERLEEIVRDFLNSFTQAKPATVLEENQEMLDQAQDAFFTAVKTASGMTRVRINSSLRNPESLNQNFAQDISILDVYNDDDRPTPQEYDDLAQMDTLGQVLTYLAYNETYKYKNVAKELLGLLSPDEILMRIENKKGGAYFKENNGDPYVSYNFTKYGTGYATLIHEAVHAVTVIKVKDAIRKANPGERIDSGVSGAAYKKMLNRTLKSKQTPEPAKRIIKAYFEAAKGLGYSSRLFESGSKRQVLIKKLVSKTKSEKKGDNLLIREYDFEEFTGNFPELAAIANETVSNYGVRAYSIPISEFRAYGERNGLMFEMDSGLSYPEVRFNKLEPGIYKDGGLAGFYDNAQSTANAGIHYGLGNVDEFLAESFSNETFQFYLSGLKSSSGNKTVWQSLKDAILEYFPFLQNPGGRSILDEVLDATQSLIKTQWVSTTYDQSGVNPEANYQQGGIDGQYMAVVKAGDTEQAQRIIDDIAKERGLKKVFHGSPNIGFTKFEKRARSSDWSVSSGETFHFATSKDMSQDYKQGGEIRPFYLIGKYAEFKVTKGERTVVNPETGEVLLVLDRKQEDELMTSDPSGNGTMTYKDDALVPDIEMVTKAMKDFLIARGFDGAFHNWNGKESIEYAVFDGENIKSAEGITKDDAGNVIPPSERFDNTNPDIRFNLPDVETKTVEVATYGTETQYLSPEKIVDVINDLTGGAGNIKVINDPSLPWAGRILNRRDIQINAANITSIQQAREVILEEAIHAVWNDAGIQDAWERIKSEAIESEVIELQNRYKEAGVNISYAIAVEEWANAEVRRKYLQETGAVRSFVDTVWNKVKEIFGFSAPANASDAARIMHRAMEYLSEEGAKSRMTPAHPVGARTFSNGQVTGMGKFYITAGHSTRAQFAPEEENALGRFTRAFAKKGEGNAAFGAGLYFWEATGTRNYYLNLFKSGRNTPVIDNYPKGPNLSGSKFTDFVGNLIAEPTQDAMLKSQILRRLEKINGRKTNMGEFLFGFIVSRGTKYTALDKGLIEDLATYRTQKDDQGLSTWVLMALNEHNEAAFKQRAAIKDKKVQAYMGSVPEPMENISSLDIMDMIEQGSLLEDFSNAAQATLDSVFPKTNQVSLMVRINLTQDQLLDWDKGYDQQSKVVREKIDRAFPEFLAEGDGWLSVGTYSPDSMKYGETFYKWLSDKLGSQEAASAELDGMGIKGINFYDADSRFKGVNDPKTSNYVVFDPTVLEIFDVEQNPQPLTMETPAALLKADSSMYNIPAKKKRNDQIKRLNKLKRLKIADKYDSNTKALVESLRRIKPKEVENLDKNHVDDFYDLVDHIYQARSRSVTRPDIRQDTSALLDELNAYHEILDRAFILKAIKDYGGVLDLSAYQKNGGDMSDRDAFTRFMNKTAQENNFDISAKTAGNKKNYDKKQVMWRREAEEGRERILSEYPDAEAWLKDIESKSSSPFKSVLFRDLLKLHFNYMTEIASFDDMEGKKLYQHFFEINNMIDGGTIYIPETSLQWIVDQRDAGVDVETLKGLFRDPVIQKNRFLNGLDKVTRLTELKQTQLDRLSAYDDARDFLQNDLMGPLLDSVLRESANDQNASRNLYLKAKKLFEKNMGREMNSEDNVTMSIVSRLIQVQTGKNFNTEFLRNIENERKAIENIIGNANKDGKGTEAMQREMREVVLPIFNKIIGDIENGNNPYVTFMETIDSRLGLGNNKAGQQRSLLLDQMQEIMDSYSLDVQIISEAFYKKPFKRYLNYLPRKAIPVNPEQRSAAKNDLKQEIGEFEDSQFQSSGYTGETEQLKDRSRIGDNASYSNNIEYIFDRGIRVSSLTASTTAERFIVATRIKKGSKMYEMIQGKGSSERLDTLNQWASSLFGNAMNSGSPLGYLGVVMKKVNEMFARVALSGAHQVVTQPLSGFTDYHFRTGNITGAMDASGYYIQNKGKMDAWFEKNASRITNRSLLGEQEFDRRRQPPLDESDILKIPFFKNLNKTYEGASKIITFSLREGDNFAAKALVMAEYVRLSQKKGYPVKSINQMNWDVVEGKILTEAMLNVERNINSSDKITRGELFTDRTAGLAIARNLALAFQSHTMILSSQFSLAVRDLLELKKNGAGKDQMATQLRTIGAIVSQTFVFSSARFGINASIAVLIVSLLQDLFDDEEGKIEELELKVNHARKTGDDAKVQLAEAELSNAKAVRRAISEFQQRSTGGGAYFNSVLKDELGVVHFAFGGPGIPQKMIFPIVDAYGEIAHKQAIKEKSEELEEKIKVAKSRNRFREAAKLKEQKFMLDSSEYAVLNIDDFGNIGLGGITGSALSGLYKSVKEFSKASTGMTEVNLNDVWLAAQSAGIGQADINRYFRTVDKIEDGLFKAKIEQEEAQEKAKKREREQRIRASNQRLETLMKQMEKGI